MSLRSRSLAISTAPFAWVHVEPCNCTGTDADAGAERDGWRVVWGCGAAVLARLDALAEEAHEVSTAQGNPAGGG